VSAPNSSREPGFLPSPQDAYKVSPTRSSVSAPSMPLAMMQSIASWKAASSPAPPPTTASLYATVSVPGPESELSEAHATLGLVAR
jgi:hypothetical protein